MSRSDTRSHILFALFATTLIVLGVLTFRALVDVWLLTFGGALAAIALHGLGREIATRTPLSTELSVGLSVVAITAAAVAGLWSLGPAVVDGVGQLRERIPEALEQVRALLSDHPQLEGYVDEMTEKASESNPVSGRLGRLGSVFSTVFGVFSTLVGALTGLLVVVIVAVYGALRPGAYTGPFVSLLPARHKGRAREVLAEIAHALRWWLVGRGSSMLVVGALTWVGLLLLGVPSAGTLALIATLLSFVPNVGPVVSAVPAILLGFSQSPSTALYVAALYVAVQSVESYVITPLIQERVVALPPASVIVVQLAFGAAFGLLGLLFATPLAVVVMVLVQMLWIQDTLEQETELP